MNDNQINVYDELTPSEMGLSTLPKKDDDRKFFLSASVIDTSFVSTEFSGHDFVDDERRLVFFPGGFRAQPCLL